MKSPVHVVTRCAVVAVVTAAFGPTIRADEPKPTGKTYRLICPSDADVLKLPPKDLHWQELHRRLDERAGRLIEIVDRSDIDSSLFIDTEGLRLYVESDESRKRFNAVCPGGIDPR